MVARAAPRVAAIISRKASACGSASAGRTGRRPIRWRPGSEAGGQHRLEGDAACLVREADLLQRAQRRGEGGGIVAQRRLVQRGGREEHALAHEALARGPREPHERRNLRLR